MKQVIETIRCYCEGLISKEEMDTALDKIQIRGAVEGKDFTGYDYGNQAWIQLHLS